MIKNIFTIGIFAAIVASAQVAPEFMVTWKADSYAPAGYNGKILPSDGTKIDAALEIIDRGKFADLSATEIRWLINDQILKKGKGLKTVSFTAEGTRGSQKIAVTAVNYRGANLSKNIVIPIAEPDVVIDSNVSTFQALPYFFNVANLGQLKFDWVVNGRVAEGDVENPQIISLDTRNLPPTTPIGVELTVTNSLKPIEAVTKLFNLTI